MDKERYRERSKFTHQQTAVAEIVQLQHVYLLIMKIIAEKPLPTYSDDANFKQQLTAFVKFQYHCITELLAVQTKQPSLTDYDNQQQGHLVMLSCGHRGKPSRPEEKRISRLLRKSGFIPMLDQYTAAQAAEPKAAEILGFSSSGAEFLNQTPDNILQNNNNRPIDRME